jgi:hypothetical protein
MNSALRSRAEVIKLARLLNREPEQLEYLEAVPAEDLRLFRGQVTDMLFTAHDGTFERLAAASKLLPAGLVAMLAQHARISGLLDPGRAVDVAAKLPTEFLAEIAVDIDPRRTSDVIGRMPADQTLRVTRELVRRGEYVTMGRFVGHLSDDGLRASIGEIDDATLLRTAFVLEERDRLDALAELVGEDRIAALAETAEREGLWPEAIDLLMNLDRERVAQGLARLDPGERELLEARAREQGVDLPAPASEGAAS